MERLRPCKFCGAKIDWNPKLNHWVDIEKDEIHYCERLPGKPAFPDNDNVAITKLLDARAAVEVLKPAKDKEQINKLSQDLYSLDYEFQDYKRKTEKRISELEDQIKKLTNTPKPSAEP